VLRRRRRKKPARKRQSQRRLTREQVEQLIAEYEAGDTMLMFAKRWRLHRTTVAEHLHRAKVSGPTARHPGRHAGMMQSGSTVTAGHANAWPIALTVTMKLCDRHSDVPASSCVRPGSADEDRPMKQWH